MNALHGIYGASGHGRDCLPLIRAHNVETIFIDDALAGQQLNGCEVINFETFLARRSVKKRVAIAIADGSTRATLASLIAQHQIEPLFVRAGNVVVMDDVEIGEGAILNPFVTLTSNIRIGRYFHANIYSYVTHDCVIGDFVTFAPGVMCNGNVVVEDYAYIGAGAVLKQGSPGKPLVIGRGAVVGMGAVVTKNVAPGQTVVGNPARPLVRT